jgi:hypothetical protein
MFINILNNIKNYIVELSSYLVIIVSSLIIFVSSLFVCNPFLSAQYSEAAAASSNQTAAQPGLPELGTRFEAMGGIVSLPSMDCLGCEFRGIVEKVSESQYSIVEK